VKKIYAVKPLFTEKPGLSSQIPFALPHNLVEVLCLSPSPRPYFQGLVSEFGLI